MSQKRKWVKGELLENVPLAPFTHWQIGGPAQRLYWPVDLLDLQQLLRTLPPLEPLTWLGLGSNVLIPDEGLSGTVIITQGVLGKLALLNDGSLLAQAGVACPQVARFAARHDLVQSEFLAGIPGTVGGALYMNAGAFGGETWPWVQSVEVISRQGDIRQMLAAEFSTGYRCCGGLPNDHWFVSATFHFPKGDGRQGLVAIQNLLDKRKQTQPTGEPCCGSVFRNPPSDYAARLIDSLGLKGFRIGDAIVSPKHANFIINLGQATAKDTRALIYQLQEKVFQAYQVMLEPEVVFL